jgi:hypothetical protein
MRVVSGVSTATWQPTIVVGLITVFDQTEMIGGTGDDSQVAVAPSLPPAVARGRPPRGVGEGPQLNTSARSRSATAACSRPERRALQPVASV